MVTGGTVTVVVLTVGGVDEVPDGAGALVADVLVAEEVTGGAENRGWRNSIQESR